MISDYLIPVHKIIMSISVYTHTVPNGGWILEYYLQNFSTYTVHRLYQRFRNIEDQEDVINDVKAQLFECILDKCTQKFCGWLICSIYSIGTNGSLQMFYLTFINYYFGLSRTGILVNSRYGIGMNLTAFDDIRKSEIIRCEQIAIRMKTQPCVYWIDNFSKWRSHNVPTVRKDVFSECLWTGITINEYVGPYVDMSPKFDERKNVVSAMPTNILEYKDAVNSGIAAIYDMGMEYFDESMVNQYAINNIPIKIDVKRHPSLASVMNSTKNTTKHTHPYKLLKLNIGSNEGLLTILRDIQTDNELNDTIRIPPRYTWS